MTPVNLLSGFLNSGPEFIRQGTQGELSNLRKNVEGPYSTELRLHSDWQRESLERLQQSLPTLIQIRDQIRGIAKQNKLPASYSNLADTLDECIKQVKEAKGNPKNFYPLTLNDRITKVFLSARSIRPGELAGVLPVDLFAQGLGILQQGVGVPPGQFNAMARRLLYNDKVGLGKGMRIVGFLGATGIATIGILSAALRARNDGEADLGHLALPVGAAIFFAAIRTMREPDLQRIQSDLIVMRSKEMREAQVDGPGWSRFMDALYKPKNREAANKLFKDLDAKLTEEAKKNIRRDIIALATDGTVKAKLQSLLADEEKPQAFDALIGRLLTPKSDETRNALMFLTHERVGSQDVGNILRQLQQRSQPKPPSTI